ILCFFCFYFFFSSRRRHTRLQGDWSSDVCSSDLGWIVTPLKSEHRISRVFGTHDQQKILALAISQFARNLDGASERAPFKVGKRSEERRVGKECRARRVTDHEKKKENSKSRIRSN